jgi:cytochrome c biogenesis protein CcdA
MLLNARERIPFYSGLALIYVFLLLVVTVPGKSSLARVSEYEIIINNPKPAPQSIVSGEQDLPALVNAGLESCPPCRRMAPFLLEFQQHYSQVFETHYYDIHKDPDASQIFQVITVPTQIYYDAQGNELHRNEGFIYGEHILEQWRLLGLAVESMDSSSSLGQVFSLDYVLSSLTMGVQGAPATAMLAALIWGFLSILLSPCHLAGIPLIVGYINARKIEKTSRAFVLSLLFALGILMSILLIGAVTVMAGRLMGDLGPLPYYLVAGVLILFGLNLTGLVPIKFSCAKAFFPDRPRKRGAIILGLILGIGLGPCTFIYIAPILGVTLALSAADILYGFVLLALFAMGHCLLLILAGMSPRFIHFFLRWNERTLSASIIKKVCGTLLVMGGAYLIYTA